jgi:TonB family protein
LTLISAFLANNTSFTPLHLAAQNGNKDVAELLLAKKAEINVKAYDGWTPLHLAARYGHKDVIELLLAKGAEVEAKDDRGKTPLDMARQDVVELLRQRDGSIGDGGRPYVLGNGVKEPVLLAQPLPPYTEEARKAHIEGVVLLQAIIRKDGTVGSIKVLRGLGYGLDESAIDTIASKWHFRPGTLNGNPVDVTSSIAVRFRL